MDDHYSPSVRLLEVERTSGSFGFNLSRSKWDPYPWVSSVDPGSSAEFKGLKPGDCVLEVNGEDVLGRRISDVADLVKSGEQVALLIWNAGCEPHCGPEVCDLLIDLIRFQKWVIKSLICFFA